MKDATATASSIINIQNTPNTYIRWSYMLYILCVCVLVANLVAVLQHHYSLTNSCYNKNNNKNYWKTLLFKFLLYLSFTNTHTHTYTLSLSLSLTHSLCMWALKIKICTSISVQLKH